MNLYLAGGVAALMLAGTAGLIVQGGQLKNARADVVRLERDLKAEKQRVTEAQALIRSAEAMGATQAAEAAIVCQGEGAELFNTGRRVGIAIGRSQCPVS